MRSIRRSRKLLFALLAAGLASVFLAEIGCRREPHLQADPNHPGRYRTGLETMGTDGAIVVTAPDEETAREMVSAALPRIRDVDRKMSTYRPESEISRLNALGPGEALKLSRPTMQVLREAKRFHQLTGEAFDVTYAPLRTLWRTAQEREEKPTEAELQQALSRVGSEKLILQEHTARFAARGMELDLGGIAKGFAIDLATEALASAGALSALVEIGGDIRLLGRRGDGSKWKIQVRDPRPEQHEPIILRLEDVAVATSGNYARFFRIGERRFSHIIDPRTGRPVDSVPSATVIAPDATTADALATSASVMGAERAVELIDSLDGAECMIMSRRAVGHKDGETRLHFSKNFRSLIEAGGPPE